MWSGSMLTLAAGSEDGKTRVWRVGGDEVVQNQLEGGNFVFSKKVPESSGYEITL